MTYVKVGTLEGTLPPRPRIRKMTRIHRICAAVTFRERANVKKAAEELGLSIAEYVRRRVMME